MKSFLKNFLIFFLFFIIIAGLLSAYSSPFKEKEKKVSLSTVVEKINAGEVRSIVVKGNLLNVVLTNNESMVAQKEASESLSTLLKNYNVDSKILAGVEMKVEDDGSNSVWLNTVFPILLPFLLIGAFIWLMLRQVQGMNQRAMNFGQGTVKAEKAAENKNRITFKDVAGIKEAKEELQEVVEFLKHPKKFTQLGAKIPKGVLLVGPAGTGKTLLARAVAGEAGVPFFHVSGSEFVEMFVGVGASRVRATFSKAKKNAPSILFIDELDAIGRQRGTGLGGSHDEREQTLNQILVEMDGFEPNTGVVVLAATNRPDVLDAALLRPGRFDRRVVVDLPDIAGREEILKIHSRGKPLASDVNLRKVAERTPGFSGADLANLMNEAAILAARRNLKQVNQKEILESIEKVILGPERKSRVLTDKEKEITAYHEAGHALVAHLLSNTDPVHKISIIARGQAGGYTLKMPEVEKHMHNKSYFLDEISVLLAGFATEKVVYGEVTTGATSDLKQATKLAKHLVTDFGMSDKLGPRTFGEHEDLIFLGREITEQRDYSEKIAETIDAEVSSLINHGYKVASEIVKKEKDRLSILVEELLKYETIERERFEELMGKKAKKEEKTNENK